MVRAINMHPLENTHILFFSPYCQSHWIGSTVATPHIFTRKSDTTSFSIICFSDNLNCFLPHLVAAELQWQKTRGLEDKKVMKEIINLLYNSFTLGQKSLKFFLRKDLIPFWVRCSEAKFCSHIKYYQKYNSKCDVPRILNAVSSRQGGLTAAGLYSVTSIKTGRSQ